MIEVSLENSVEQFGSGISTNSIIEDLGSKAKDFVGFKCKKNGTIYDLHSCLRGPICLVPILKNTKDHLSIMRNDTAYVLSYVLNEKYKSKIVDINITEDGFYVDFYNKNTISQKDFAKIELEMKNFIVKNEKFILNSVSKDEALEIFDKLDNKFIVERINQSSCEDFNIHSHSNYKILSSGPRSLNSKDVSLNFKLLSISGSSWDHGDEKLQRIHGTSLSSKEDLEQHLKNIEEILKWDHRIIGKNMDLFNIDPEVASGMVFWLPNGVFVLNRIKEYLRSVWEEYGYNEISTPIVMNASLWEKSGHTEMFRENMMFMKLQDNEYALKPMSCPGHINIFNLGNKSYRDLPYKLSEFGMCHRYEPSGSLHGLMRARSFTQDDAHVFCSEDNIESSILVFCEMLKKIYKKFGFDNILVCLATRPEKYIGEIESWSKAEKSLEEAAFKSGFECSINEGEGAFYGPKLEFSIKDKKGHIWQCGTVQVDFSLAKRLDAVYTDEKSTKQNPVVVHHAVLGSLERFLGILLENTMGLLPTWVHPHPVVIIPISSDQINYAHDVKEKIKSLNMAISIDDSNQTLGYKIRNCATKRSKVTIILGKKEEQGKTVTLRSLEGKEESLTLENLIIKLENI